MDEIVVLQKLFQIQYTLNRKLYVTIKFRTISINNIADITHGIKIMLIPAASITTKI